MLNAKLYMLYLFLGLSLISRAQNSHTANLKQLDGLLQHQKYTEAQAFTKKYRLYLLYWQN